MIRIVYDEIASTIKIDVEAGGESGTMTVQDMVLHLVAVVGGVGNFIREEVGENTMKAFFNAIRELDNTELIRLFEVGVPEEIMRN